MAQPPKPLPRTKLRSAPVRILIEADDELSSDVTVNVRPRPSVPNLTPRSGKQDERRNSTKDQSAIIVISEDGSADERLRILTKNENVEGETNSAIGTAQQTAENVTTTHRTEDDDVVDEILSYKAKTHDRRIFDQDNSPVGSAKSARNDLSITPDLKSPDNESVLDRSEDLLAIHIHRSDCLKMDRIIRHPSVIVHIVDADKNGEYLQKTQPNKNVTYNQEQSNFILPVMTRPFSFKDHLSIIPEWGEILTFNENTSYIVQPSRILFFEIVDFVDSSNSDTEYASIGWHRIAWAFLRPNKSSNFNKILRLQLYKANPKMNSISTKNIPCVYSWFRSKKWKPYPSTLFITVESISSCKVDSRPQQRSCTPLQPEVGSDASVKSLGIFSSDDEDKADSKSADLLSAVYRLNSIEWSRLPGQSCHIPNSKIASLYPDPKGCLVVKFSPSGIFLACGTCSDIIIYAIDGVLEKRLGSHQGLIYSLCWFTDDSLLMSASADCTVCVWDMRSASEIPLQILPHPSFVYCSTFLFPESTIVTGCYDGMIRIWWQTHACSRFWQLNQELTGHEEYVNALCPYRNKEFFSGDSVGVIIHWAADEYGRWFKLNIIKLNEIQGIVINKLMPFPGNKRLLIHTRDSLLRTMDIKTSVVIQWYQGGLNDTSQCNSTITPCGSYVFSISEDGTVGVWESNTGKQMAFYSSETLSNSCGGSVDYHPFDHISAFSFYSSNYNSSSVLLLKYNRGISSRSDVMLYTLNENMNFSPGHMSL